MLVDPQWFRAVSWRREPRARYAYRNLLVAVEAGAARITLNRPEKRNALSLELMQELTAALCEVSAQAATRAIVIEGAGPAFYRELFGACTVLMETIPDLAQPVNREGPRDRDRRRLPARGGV
jgi:hypothetical protein